MTANSIKKENQMSESYPLQPNSRQCFVCGLENPAGLHLRFFQTGPGEVTAHFTAPQQFQGFPGVVHGGIVAAMLDEAAGRCLMEDTKNPRFMFTAKLDVRYRQNVPVGQPLRIVGRAGRSKARTAEGQAFVYDAQDRLLAEASALLMNVPDDTFDLTNLDQLGWKVYPE